MLSTAQSMIDLCAKIKSNAPVSYSIFTHYFPCGLLSYRKLSPDTEQFHFSRRHSDDRICSYDAIVKYMLGVILCENCVNERYNNSIMIKQEGFLITSDIFLWSIYLVLFNWTSYATVFM